MPKLSKKYLKMAPLYKSFAQSWGNLDFSDEALNALYVWESTGQGIVKPDNGFAHGKKWLNVQVEMWREDLWKTLWPWELYEDPAFPHWWLDSVFAQWAPNWKTNHTI